MNFGEQIKKIRTEKNLTQQKMADMLNVSRQAVSNWENDKNLPDIEMIINMSRAFNMTLDELVFGGKDMNNMTEKLINDGSENRRKNMNLIGIKIGASLLGAGVLSLLIGLLVPPSMENHFGMAFSTLIFCGVLTFLLIGVKDIVELVLGKNTDSEKSKMKVFGGVLVGVGSVMYLLGLVVDTDLSLGTYGILAMFIGIVMMVIPVLIGKSKK